MAGSITFFSLKIPMGMPKNFFKIYSQFGHVPSKMFTSPALDNQRF